MPRGENPGPDDENVRRAELLAALVHELRSPLNVVLGWAHLLRSGQLDEASSAHGIEAIRRNTELQGQLLSDAHDLSLIMAGRLSIELQPVQVAPILKSALETARDDARDKEVHLEAAPVDAGFVSGDPERLRQILGRLLASAVGFSSPGSAILIGARRADAVVEISIRIDDCGVAIDDALTAFRAGANDKRPYGGLGPRLARCLIEMHRGALDATGSGSCATLTLRLPGAEGAR